MPESKQGKVTFKAERHVTTAEQLYFSAAADHPKIFLSLKILLFEIDFTREFQPLTKLPWPNYYYTAAITSSQPCKKHRIKINMDLVRILFICYLHYVFAFFFFSKQRKYKSIITV